MSAAKPYDPYSDPIAQSLVGKAGGEFLLFVASDYLVDPHDQHLFLEHFVPLASKYPDRPKDKEVLDVVKSEQAGMIKWGWTAATFAFTNYSPKAPRIKTLAPMEVRRMVTRMFISLHLHELQMLGHPRMEEEDFEYLPTPIPSEQFDLKFIMTGEETKEDWKEEWYGAVRRDPLHGKTFETTMAQDHFKNEVYPLVAKTFAKAVTNWDNAKGRLKEAKWMKDTKIWAKRTQGSFDVLHIEGFMGKLEQMVEVTALSNNAERMLRDLLREADNAALAATKLATATATAADAVILVVAREQAYENLYRYLMYLMEVLKALEVGMERFTTWELRYAKIRKRDEDDPIDPGQRYDQERKRMPIFLAKFTPIAFAPGTRGKQQPTIWFTLQVNCHPFMNSSWLRKAINMLCKLMAESTFESPMTLMDILRQCTDGDLMEHFTLEKINEGMARAQQERDHYAETGSIKMSKLHAMMHALIDLLVEFGCHWELTSEVMLTGHISTVVGEALKTTKSKPVRVRGTFALVMEKLKTDNAFFISLKRLIRHIMARINQHDPTVYRAVNRGWPDNKWASSIPDNADFTTEASPAWLNFAAQYQNSKLMWKDFLLAVRTWDDTLVSAGGIEALVAVARDRFGEQSLGQAAAVQLGGGTEGRRSRIPKVQRGGYGKPLRRQQQEEEQDEEETSDEHIPAIGSKSKGASSSSSSYKGSRKPCFDYYFKGGKCRRGDFCPGMHSEKEADWKILKEQLESSDNSKSIWDIVRAIRSRDQLFINNKAVRTLVKARLREYEDTVDALRQGGSKRGRGGYGGRGRGGGFRGKKRFGGKREKGGPLKKAKVAAASKEEEDEGEVPPEEEVETQAGDDTFTKDDYGEDE